MEFLKPLVEPIRKVFSKFHSVLLIMHGTNFEESRRINESHPRKTKSRQKLLHIHVEITPVVHALNTMQLRIWERVERRPEKSGRLT
jgi:hypothetical protein